MNKFGDLAVGLIRSYHVLDAFCVKGAHSEGEYSFVDDDATRKILSCFFLIACLQILQSFLFVFFFEFFAFFDGLVLFAYIATIEHADGFDVVVGKQFKHFEDVIEEGVGFDVLVMVVGTAIATFVDPGHDVDGCSLVAKGADVFFEGDRVEQFE